MDEQLKLAHEAIWAMVDDGWLYCGPEGLCPIQQKVYDYTLKYPRSPDSAKCIDGEGHGT